MTWLPVLAFAVVGCATTPSFPVAEPFSDGPLHWQPCPPLPPVPTEPPGECSRTRVPLRWDDRAGRQIEIAVRRFEPATPRRGTLWLLDGGPGGTGNTFNTPAWRSISVDRGLAMMIPTHRGSGFSTPLACPAEEAPDSDLGAWVSRREAASCARALEATWGAGLGAFSSYEAARDLAHLMARERRAAEQLLGTRDAWGAAL